jgi:hypothetical protein
MIEIRDPKNKGKVASKMPGKIHPNSSCIIKGGKFVKGDNITNYGNCTSYGLINEKCEPDKNYVGKRPCGSFLTDFADDGLCNKTDICYSCKFTIITYMGGEVYGNTKCVKLGDFWSPSICTCVKKLYMKPKIWGIVLGQECETITTKKNNK